MSKPDSIISLSALSAGFKARPHPTFVLDSVSGSVASGELVSLIGANGSGKSTLIRTLVGILPSLGGSINLFGKGLNLYSRPHLARLIAYVAAGVPVSNNMSVKELVTLGRFPYTNWIGRINREDETKVDESIESVGLSSLKHRDIFSLSDGEKQRAMIARALAQDPAILVLDEPMAFLDLPNRYELVSLLGRLAKEQNKAILFSTHDLNIAISESDKIWLIQDHKMSEGAPEDLLLNGKFISLFGESKLQFFEEDGTFRFPISIKRRISLISDDKLGSLTKRALLRLNIDTGEEKSDHTITTSYNGEDAIWLYTGPAGTVSFTNIYDLSIYLKSVLK